MPRNESEFARLIVTAFLDGAIVALMATQLLWADSPTEQVVRALVLALWVTYIALRVRGFRRRAEVSGAHHDR